MFESEADVHTLSEMLVRSDHEHVAALKKREVDHDLALRISSTNALQQGQDEGQCHGQETGASFVVSRF